MLSFVHSFNLIHPHAIPILHRHIEAVTPSLHSNSPEFGGFKIWIVQLFPYSHEINRALIIKPLLYQTSAILKILGHIRQTDIIILVFIEQHIDSCVIYLYCSCLCHLLSLCFCCRIQFDGNGRSFLFLLYCS